MWQPSRYSVRQSYVRAASVLGLVTSLASGSAAQAITIELKDAAPDRVERQRAAAVGQLPLPNTPDTSRTAERLAAKGLSFGAPIFIRILKAESELEIWVEKDGLFIRFDTYPICHFSGTLGPKLREGDKQAPEGFYTVGERQLRKGGRWPGSLNVGYPNAFDKSQASTGSAILIHGGCTSAGCFAMTNPVIKEIYEISRAAFDGGQTHVPVHVFPFRMTEENLERYKSRDWDDFWRNLKSGYDIFEASRRLPKIEVCDDKYVFADTVKGSTAKLGPIAVCSRTAEQIAELERIERLLPAKVLPRLIASARAGMGISSALAAPSLQALAVPAGRPIAAANFHRPGLTGNAQVLADQRTYGCSPGLASCRKYMALQDRKIARRPVVAQQARRRVNTASVAFAAPPTVWRQAPYPQQRWRTKAAAGRLRGG